MSRDLSPADDLLVHQSSGGLRYAATSDTNFYDRHYLSAWQPGRDLMLVAGLGEYPNLGSTDAFLALRTPERQVVLRSSDVLRMRGAATAGPIRVEVLEGLRRLRLVVEESEGVSADLVFDGVHVPRGEPHQFGRVRGRVVYDVSRYGQMGSWSGRVVVDGEETVVEPATWRGYRDRSWGLRPIGPIAGEANTDAGRGPGFLWLYCAAVFPDYSLMIKVHELESGRRPMEEAVRIWHDPERPAERLGRVEVQADVDMDRREMTAARLRTATVTVEAEQRLPLYLHAGTGYGDDPSWRHGMNHGRRVVGRVDSSFLGGRPCGGMVDASATFRAGDDVGSGLFEYGVVGAFPALLGDVRFPGFWNEV